MKGTEGFYRRFPRLMFMLRRLERANYEREMKLLDILCDADLASLDVGAKVGMYTFRIAKHSGSTIAFEPNPLFGGMLQAVFAKKCRVERVALSDVDGESELRIPFDSRGTPYYGRCTIEPANKLVATDVLEIRRETVPIRRLDSYGFSQLGFVKIDVEGHELAVLRGGQATIEDSRPSALIESNEAHCEHTVQRLFEWFTSRDYHGFFVDGTNLSSIARFDLERHQEQQGVENFIFLPAEKTEARNQLVARFDGLLA